MIHLNTAGSGLMSAETLSVMRNYLQAEYSHGAYETELSHMTVLEDEVYSNIAKLLGSNATDIAIFDGATRAWVTLLDSLCWHQGDRILVTPYEYAGNLIALHRLNRRYGVVIEVMPLLPSGELDLHWLTHNMTEEIKLVSVVHIPSCCGIINDIEAIGKILSSYPCFYYVDACQSAGLLSLDVKSIGCDVLTAAGRKFICGPRGTGFAYLSKRFSRIAQPRFTDLSRASVDASGEVNFGIEDARRFEYAERNHAAVAGLNQAVKERLAGSSRRSFELYRSLYNTLAHNTHIKLIAPGIDHAGIIAFNHSACSATEFVDRMRADGVNCWPGHASHTPYFMLKQTSDRFVRLSVNDKNSAKDIETFVSLLDNF